VPLIAIPTTCGTGSEVTRNAVLCSPGDRVKASLRSPLMLPRIALIDPDLLAGLPREALASSGLDALSQLIEPFVSVRRNKARGASSMKGNPIPLTDPELMEIAERPAGAMPP
jgi:alcohol dehydrogenase class IV